MRFAQFTESNHLTDIHTIFYKDDFINTILCANDSREAGERKIRRKNRYHINSICLLCHYENGK